MEPTETHLGIDELGSAGDELDLKEYYILQRYIPSHLYVIGIVCPNKEWKENCEKLRLTVRVLHSPFVIIEEILINKPI